MMIEQRKGLAIFDMDFTISEDYLEECLFSTMHAKQYDQRLQEFHSKKKKWPTLLGEVIARYPPEQHRIESWMQQTKVVEGIELLLENLHKRGYELILLSGGNSHLANKFLQTKGLLRYFSRVIAPQLEQHTEGYRYDVTVTNCHLEDVCHHGFCKGVALNQHYNDHATKKILYFGDGINDLCGMHLINDGMAFIRRGKYLHRRLQQHPSAFDHIIRCQKLFWQDGHQALLLLDKHTN